MSKVISFSISDKYLDKLRTLYPALTDNLAVKQFVRDGLDSSLGSSLDGSLDGDLDGKLKSLIESELDGLLEGRLDATEGKLITSLSERMARLEERLDDGLDGRLDESIARLGSCFSHRLLGLEKRLDKMELLLRMQREASITSLIPTGEPSHFPTIEETPDIEPVATVEAVIENADTVGTDSTVEPVTGSIGPVRGDSIGKPCKGMNAAEAFRYVTSKGVKVSQKTLSNWVKLKEIPITDKGDKVSEYLVLRGKLYYPID